MGSALGKAVLIATVLTAAMTACAPKSELDATQMQVAALQSENAQMKAQLEKKADLPISVSFRAATFASGYVAAFNTTVKAPLSVLVSLESKSLGTTKQLELHLDGATTQEVGGLDGMVFELGDKVTVKNQDYAPLSLIVTAS